MRDSLVSSIGLIVAVGLGAIIISPGPSWTSTIANAVILLIVLVSGSARAPEAHPVLPRSTGQSVAFSAACGFLLFTCALFLLKSFPDLSASLPLGQFWFPALFCVCWILFLIVDRFRNGSKPVAMSFPSRPLSFETPPPASVPTEAPARPAPEAVPDTAVLVAAPEPLPNHPASEAVAQPVPHGRPATIYLNLMDAGLACLRPVGAEHLGRDYYVIVETPPAGESWQFQTGQIVRCRKQKLSSGKAMVAFEEAPRAH